MSTWTTYRRTSTRTTSTVSVIQLCRTSLSFKKRAMVDAVISERMVMITDLANMGTVVTSHLTQMTSTTTGGVPMHVTTRPRAIAVDTMITSMRLMQICAGTSMTIWTEWLTTTVIVRMTIGAVTMSQRMKSQRLSLYRNLQCSARLSSSLHRLHTLVNNLNL